MSNETKDRLREGFWHHTTESNWVPYVIIACVCGVVFWMYTTIQSKELIIQDQAAKIANAELASEVSALTMAEIAVYVNNRLDNLEKSKDVANAVFKGERVEKY